MKKIAIITTRKGSVSGTSIFMEHFRKHLREKGYRADLLRPVPTQLESISQLGYCAGYFGLKEKIAKYDLVIGNGVGLIGALDVNVKVIDNMHSNSVAGNFALQQAYENIGPLERQYLNRLLNRVCDISWKQIPEVLTTNKMIFKVDKLVAKRADRIIAVSPLTARNAINHFGVPKKKVTHVLNGIDDIWFEPRQTDPFMETDKVNVVYTGRIGDSALVLFLKGFDRVLGALSHIRRNGRAVCLAHVGASQRTEELGALLKDGGIEYKFNIKNEDLPRYLRAGDIYVLTSRTEAFSLSLAEAMASGLVPVSFPVGIAPDVIKDGYNGYIVESVEAMREKIAFLLKNGELRADMSERARATAKKHFNMQKMIQSYMKEIDALLMEDRA
jgi:glycosyltransferase involved in cell wall biosynthesis